MSHLVFESANIIVLFSAIWHKYGEASLYVCKKEKHTQLPRTCKKYAINVLSKMHACLPSLDRLIFPA